MTSNTLIQCDIAKIHITAGTSRAWKAQREGCAFDTTMQRPLRVFFLLLLLFVHLFIYFWLIRSWLGHTFASDSFTNDAQTHEVLHPPPPHPPIPKQRTWKKQLIRISPQIVYSFVISLEI